MSAPLQLVGKLRRVLMTEEDIGRIGDEHMGRTFNFCSQLCPVVLLSAWDRDA